MTLDQSLRDYLEASGESMRALSLRAGLNPKAVSDILNIPGLRPRHSTLSSLSAAIGSDLFEAQAISSVTYSDLIDKACSQGKNGIVSKLRWLCRHAGWAPELKQVCKQDVIDFFDSNEPARFDLSPGSYATYRSALVRAVGLNQPRERKRSINDIAGHYQEVYKAIQAGDLPNSAKYACGPFLVFCTIRKSLRATSPRRPSRLITTTGSRHLPKALHVARSMFARSRHCWTTSRLPPSCYTLDSCQLTIISMMGGTSFEWNLS
ncbi:hypothetical protein LCGC14_1829520 [marine sediment metagenome]|uniref:Uncharacterized protein n=1 Tax=marine sediment metagenome TaxID=412755 RepID=A0A0F9JG20_9ZZZZ